MQSKPKSNSVVTSVYDEERGVIVFTVLGAGDVELDLNKVHEANMKRAAIHGWNQRIPDAAAIGRADADGNIIPEDERTQTKFERMQALCAHYETGTEEWNRKGSGGGGGGKSPTIEAFARVQGLSYDEAEVRVEEMAAKAGITRKAKLGQLSKMRDVALAALDIKRERLLAQTPAFDADKALEEAE